MFLLNLISKRTLVAGALALAACSANGQMGGSNGSSGQGGATSGSQPAQQNAPMDSMTQPGMDGMSGASAAKDKMFLKESAGGSMVEIKTSQLALQKSSSDEIKQFAQKMIDDHTMLMEKMKPFAEKSGVTPPDKLPKDGQKMYDKLSALSGPQFDKEYVMGMMKDHHKDLKMFQSEQSSTKNTELKATVAEGQKVIQEHTDMIDKIAAAHKGAQASM